MAFLLGPFYRDNFLAILSSELFRSRDQEALGGGSPTRGVPQNAPAIQAKHCGIAVDISLPLLQGPGTAKGPVSEFPAKARQD